MIQQLKKRCMPLAALCLSVIMVMGLMAGAVDTSMDCSLTVTVSGGTDVNGVTQDSYPELMAASVNAHLYRVASITADYQYNAVAEFAALDLADLKDIGRQDSVLNQDAYTAGWSEIAQEAAALTETNGAKPTNLPITGNGTFENLAAGLYLLVMDDAYINDHIYQWSPYLVSVPSMSADDGSDMYDVAITLKPAQLDRPGNLIINKTLASYAAGTGQATAVFRITGTKNDVQNYSNVVSLTFDSAGEKSVTIEGIPVGTVITVEEIRYGGSYEQTEIDPENGTVTIVPLDTDEEQATVSFTNEYNGTPIYSTSVTNHFEKTTTWELSQMDDNSN